MRTSRTLLVAMVMGVLGLACHAAPGAEDYAIVATRRSRYHDIYVVEQGDWRKLCFRRHNRLHIQSQYCPAQPLRLTRHARQFFTGLLLTPTPKRVLFIGVGAGVVPRVFHQARPNATLECVDIDPEVLSVAAEHFDLKGDERMQLVARDGRTHVKLAQARGRRYDMIVLDVWDGGTTPFHLHTREFLEQMRAILEPDGCVVVNLHGNLQLYDYQRRTYAAVFAETYTLFDGDNRITIAAPRKHELDGAALRERAQAFDAASPVWLNLTEVAAFYENRTDYQVIGPLLTDDYAPVNALNKPREGQ